MLFTSVFTMTYVISLTCSCLIYILVWIAIPEIARYRFTSFIAIIALSLVLQFQYSTKDYNPGHHYKTVAGYLHEQENVSVGRQ